jgi:acyl-ACP thioesterase
VDPFNQCRPSALLGYLQEAATEAACALHVSREEMIDKYHVFWMLARMWYRLDRPLFLGRHRHDPDLAPGDKGASMYRDFDLFRDGERVGEAVSVWVLADLDTHKLFRLSNVMEFRDTTGGELCKDKTLGRLRVPVALHPAEERPMRYSDADINGHVNNVRYADFACDALDMQRLGRGGACPRSRSAISRSAGRGRSCTCIPAFRTAPTMSAARGPREKPDLRPH